MKQKEEEMKRKTRRLTDEEEMEEGDGDIDDFESQVSLNTSTHENGAYTNRETGSSDQFGVVRVKNKTIDGRAGERVYDHDKFRSSTRNK